MHTNTNTSITNVVTDIPLASTQAPTAFPTK